MDITRRQRRGFYEFFGVPQPDFDAEKRFISSPFMSPLVLGIIRILIAVYMTACCIAGPILQLQNRRTRRHAYRFPAYFTNITFMALTWYFFHD
jgi:predicted small integral membrane protein